VVQHYNALMSGVQKNSAPKGDVGMTSGGAVGQIVDARASRTYQTAVLFGLILGATLIFTGVGLCIAGISGSIEWVVSAKGFGSRLANASPGVFFAVMGFLIVIRYKPRYKFSFSATQQTAPQGKGKQKKAVVIKIQGTGEMSALPDPKDRRAR
jgi:hypothetical protein